MIPQELATKQMNRKDFLKVMGIGILTIFGINNYLSYFLKHHSKSQPAAPAETSSHGFGSRSFGK